MQLINDFETLFNANVSQIESEILFLTTTTNDMSTCYAYSCGDDFKLNTSQYYQAIPYKTWDDADTTNNNIFKCLSTPLRFNW